MKIVFATHNQNKIKEVKLLLSNNIKILSLNDINCNELINETGNSLVENAWIKSNYVKTKYGYDCFSDDTGLEIESLGGEPGVKSARYSGIYSTDKKNIDLVLKLMKNKTNRNAQFRTCIALIINDNKELFEGIVKGKIIHQRKGKNGFGYDSIFIPNGLKKTFAEMDLSEKNKISHRGIALKKLSNYFHNSNY
ncbi:MAG: non-canonical purine NTP pyrophosphatase, RdgB/HAM1 family [Flavobacteriaceae bacterium]|nr:non-canonical purine NTP pyrophosphatase, RdgB/HAM1 family [Flavobacteriaceae bacterium]|tara:strand:- start:1593 stop:2174 length:582 start_codon:yes stop_codon:yes gene_type:complete